MQYLAIVLAFITVSAYASHDPGSPKSYKDFKYEKAMDKCYEKRDRMREQFQLTSSNAAMQAQNKKHLEKQFKKCKDNAVSKARRRHGLER